ncbi:GNAT family N-acetyltransferase [Escherichia marmotae]|uniref:GNAT family N-acetyltransferase n=1 Tax=Escherichia marmotae TaxID=1499973 RepID=UPI001E634A47|nr:GNAT family N-acetyltransferase [Escherichia marmotae]MEC9693670.1 GNAT family N-acetyltransferase [Escherichia marmotae]MEC9799417.1 GNAT family N-acetyltransferase [Escherichia marmotae]MEC9884064.1 GNAT family N-acetyltransferase [Escherichia marmotae]MED9304240.1 GNAT family N-acetyltransferase [Escherichia marmotae]MED9382487.1 GNAT family N-acetyltransferase [Escherichia marmotae]
MNNISIRDYRPGDFQHICAIFLRAVTMTASQHYSPQQIAAWAQIDETRWKKKIAQSQVRVAVIDEQPVGFITLIDRYIDLLFVDPKYTRRGVASALLKPSIKSESELTVNASITAKPFFERYGFQIVKQQNVECRGEWLTNFYMRYQQPD